MIYLEDQVCTLEQAKKLKELGICEDSYFNIYENGGIYGKVDYDLFPDGAWKEAGKAFNAYTSAELGDMISVILDWGWQQSILTNYEDKKYHRIEFKYPSKKDVCNPYENGFDMYYFSTIMIEAHARAEFLIYLLGKVVKDEDIIK